MARTRRCRTKLTQLAQIFCVNLSSEDHVRAAIQQACTLVFSQAHPTDWGSEALTHEQQVYAKICAQFQVLYAEWAWRDDFPEITAIPWQTILAEIRALLGNAFMRGPLVPQPRTKLLGVNSSMQDQTPEPERT